MNTASASRADPPVDRPVLVWDLPLRIFHWLLALSFAGAWITAESERWRLLHVTLGYTMAGLLVFRLLWGLWGTRHARFASFVRGPGAVMRYLQSLRRGRPERHAGHNPAGAWAIVAMLALGAAVALTGWAVYREAGGKWLEHAHEAAAQAMLALVALHLVAVAVSSWLHRENLVGAMLTGRKTGRADEGIRKPWRAVGAAVLIAVLGFWSVQWQSAPAAGTLADGSAAMRAHDDDD